MQLKHKTITIIIFAIVILMSNACNQTPAEALDEPPTAQPMDNNMAEESAPSATQPPARKPKRPPVNIPGEVPEPNRTLADTDASIKSEEGRVLSGDNFLNNLYERPFTAVEMVYQPDLDIYEVDFAYDDDYFYFTIRLNGPSLEGQRLTGMYGIEFDLDLDGRGDLIVLSENPMPQWGPKNVRSFQDTNEDVGGLTPMIADEGFEGNGYDQRTEINVDNLAFARLAPDEPYAVQMAVSYALLSYPDTFLWGAWVDKGRMEIRDFDYNDTMGPSEAGSPFIDNEDYPIKALFNFDNTCRLPFGFEQMGSYYPGMCITMAPTAAPAEGQSEPPQNNCYCNDLCVDGVTCCGSIICP